MNSLIFPLIFLSPVLVYALNLLLQESRDPVEPFHDRYRLEKVAKRNENYAFEKQSYLNGDTSLLDELGSLSQSKVFVIVAVSILFIAFAPPFQALLIIPSAIVLYLFIARRKGRELKKSKSQRIARELPAVTELFAILISSGESMSSALKTLSKITSGEITPLLTDGVELLHQGVGLTLVLDSVSRQSDVPQLRRFCDSLIIAAERGSSLGDVLGRQVVEIRSKEHARKLEAAGRAEIALMIPVVFLILPISVLFALWPSYIALGQSASF